MPWRPPIFYSMYGHIYRMAEAAAEGGRPGRRSGGRALPGAGVGSRGGFTADRSGQGPRGTRAHTGRRRRPPGQCGRNYHRNSDPVRKHVRADAQLLGQTGALWAKGALAGKVGSVFTSAGSRHGGQETTMVSVHWTLLHHGMIIVGVPYSEPGLSNVREISGGSP